MNKTFSNNRKLYPSFLEFRHTENRRPPQASATRWRPACKAPPSTLTRTFSPGLALADTRRHTPDYDATLTQYLALLDAHGVARGVLVQPSFLGTDNSHLVAARAAAGRLRGVAVVSPDIAAADLLALAEAGVAGIRLNLIGLPLPALDQPAWQELLAHVNTLGWHVEVHLQASRLPAIMPALLAAGCRVVIDHFGRPDPALGIADPGFAYLLRQADSGQVWVKLAAPYRNWPAPDCARAGREAARLLLDAYARPTHVGQRLAPYRASPPGVLHRGDAVAGRLDRRCRGAASSACRYPAAVVSIHWRSTMTLCSNASPAAAPAAGRRTAGRRRRRGLGRLPRARDHAGGHLSARRHGRRRCPPDRPQAGRRAGPARGDREPWRRGRHDRRRGRRQGPARRLR